MRRLFHYRLMFLGIVNALILLHLFFYYVLDRRSLGCVDFFGLATFLGNGQITAGTVFLGIVVATSLILGRVFCGWGCHFAFFQDGLLKILQRLGLRVSYRRSRLEWIVPPVLFLVTLAYPILVWWRDRGLPRAVTVDMSYPDLWHLLPGVKGVLLILLVDVVALTLLFGGRAFCRFLCPYGLFLKFFHAVSPMRVVKTGDCSNCDACTRACPAGVPIKYELKEFGLIRDLNCMNCGDCVAACPDQVLKLKPTKAAYTLGLKRGVRSSGQPAWVEILLLVGVIAGLLLYRGREYGDFLAAGLGLVVGALSVTAIQPSRFLSRTLAARLSGTPPRVALALVAIYFVLGMAGQFLGRRTLDNGNAARQAFDFERAESVYTRGQHVANVFRPFTFYLDAFDDRSSQAVVQLEDDGDQLLTTGRWKDAAHVYRAILAMDPARLPAYGNLGMAYFKQGQYWDAARCYMKILESDPNDLVALYHLAMARIELGQLEAAADLVLKILTVDTVGNAYKLIRANPLFGLLNHEPSYRRAMSMYPRNRSGTAKESR